MAQKTKKTLSVVLTILMLIPMFSAFFTVSTSAGAVKDYATASDGDLLYTANFKGDDAWAPAQTSWGSMTASAFSDGSGASFSPTAAYKNGWGGAVTGLPVAGKAYTVVFTAKSVYNEGQHIGVSLNGGGYVFVTPGRDRYALGWWNSYNSKQAFAGYTHSGDAGKNIARTYAIEVAADTEGNATLYKFYVKDGYSWSLIYTMTDFSNFNWDADENLSLVFVKYLAGSKGTNAIDDYNQKRTDSASVEDVRVYKGNVAENGGYVLSLDGDKLLDVTFSTAEDNTALFKNGKNQGTVTVSDDGKEATLTPTGGMIWGDLSDYALPAGNGEKYTIYFHADFSTGTGIWFGIYPDAYSGIPMKDGGNARPQHSTSKEADGNNWRNKSDYGADVRDFAIEIDTDTNAQTLYAKNKYNGTYTAVISYSNFANAFSGDTLSCSLFSYCTTANSYVTFSGVSVYKGFTVEEYDQSYYDSFDEGNLIKEINFAEEGWNPGFATSSNQGADVAVSANGKGATFTISTASGDNYRSMWGAPLTGEKIPLGKDVKYTFLFDLTLSDDNAGFAFYPDNNNGLVISGDGTVRWWNWNTRGETGDKKWTDCTDKEKTDRQTFAVVMDYAAGTYSLYVQRVYGSFGYVTTVHGSWDEYSEMTGRFYARDIGTYNAESGSYDYEGGYTVTVENFKILKGDSYAPKRVLDTATGASVRLNDPTGIRFTGLIGKEYYRALVDNWCQENVKLGILIVPTSYLTDNNIDFTMDDLEGCRNIPEGKKYVKINAVTILESDDGNAYLINCALTNVNEANYDRDFSAIVFVEVNMGDDHPTVYYSVYNEDDHSRSIARVAAMALSDMSSTQTGEYQNEVPGEYQYSPYTEDQREILQGFAAKNSYTVMSYNIERNETKKETFLGVTVSSTTDWEGRDPSKAISTINAASPDIAGLQEVTSEWDTYLAALDGYTIIKGDTSASAFDDLCYKTDLFTCTASGWKNYKSLASLYTSVDDGGADMNRDNSKRMFTYAFLTDKNTGRKILAISTHLHYRQNSSDTAATTENDLVRSYEIRLLEAWIDSQNTALYDCIVVVGDMNAHYKSGTGKAVIANFTDYGFENSIVSAAIKNGNCNNTLAVTDRTVLSSYVFDYVFTKGNAENIMFTVLDNRIDNSNTSYPSDHLPVMARIYCK